ARSLAAAPAEEVEQIIRPTGFFRQKAKAIIGCAGALMERFGGKVPRRLDDLAQLPGVGRKTANVVLSSCWPRPQSDHGVAVDTHVRRVSQRLALTAEDDPDRIERDLLRLLPVAKWAIFSYQVIKLGRGPCTARNPKHGEGALLERCPTGAAAAGGQPRRRHRPQLARSFAGSHARRARRARG